MNAHKQTRQDGWLKKNLPSNMAIAWPPLLVVTVLGANIGIFISAATLQTEIAGWSNATLGTVYAAWGVGKVLSHLALPRTAHWVINRTFLIATMAILIIATCFLWLYSAHVWMWVVYSAIRGVLFTQFYHVMRLWLLAGSDSGDHGRLFALFYIGLCAGNLAGPPVVAALGISGVTFMLMALALSIVIGVFLSSSLPHIRVKHRKLSDLMPVLHAGWGIWLLAMIAGYAGEVTFGFISRYGFETGMDKWQALWLYNFMLIGSVAMQYPLAVLMDKSGKPGFISAMAVAVVVTALALSFTAGSAYAVVVAVVIVWGALVSMLAIAGDAMASRFFGADKYSEAMMLSAVFYVIGNAAGSKITGWAIDAMGPDGLVAVTCVICAMAVPAVALIKKAGLKKADPEHQ